MPKNCLKGYCQTINPLCCQAWFEWYFSLVLNIKTILEGSVCCEGCFECFEKGMAAFS